MLSFQTAFHLAAGAAAFGLLAACASAPFSYAQDRCRGGHNQCQAQCASIDNGPARSACQQRCLTRENQCYATGDDGVGSTLAQDALISSARTRAEKEAAYEAWKARRDKEREAAEAAGEPVDTEPAVIEIIE